MLLFNTETFFKGTPICIELQLHPFGYVLDVQGAQNGSAAQKDKEWL